MRRDVGESLEVRVGAVEFPGGLGDAFFEIIRVTLNFFPALGILVGNGELAGKGLRHLDVGV